MKLKLISCEIFYREMCAAVARSPHQVDVEFLSKGLHDMTSQEMVARIQEVLDRVEAARYDAVVLGYALCNNGLVGLQARYVPLVLPRAHDCISLFLGSSQRYLQYFNDHPGVYFMTTGWMERGKAPGGELKQHSITHKTGMDQTYEEMVQKYGEENAKFLWETLGDMTRNYTQFTFIEMGIEPDDSFERQTRDEAAARGWKYEKVAGDMSMIQRLLNAQWDEKEVLVVQPGYKIVASFDDGIIAAEKV
ncbi:MAG TPA: DUF1638 domain-containing protein [Planctomycetota bacterium]|jgi:hypothetical protein